MGEHDETYSTVIFRCQLENQLDVRKSDIKVDALVAVFPSPIYPFHQAEAARVILAASCQMSVARRCVR